MPSIPTPTIVRRCFLLITLLSVAAQALNPPPFYDLTLSRQTIEGDSHGGEGYTVLPLLRNATPATAILLHGLGGSGEEWGFVSLALSFFSLNYVKFVIPSAPVKNVTYLKESLPSWFDILSLNSRNAVLNKSELLTSVTRVNAIVRGEIQQGVSQDRIFIIGFSQGGAVALTAFLRSPVLLAGCVGVATWLPLAGEYPSRLSPVLQNRQILMLHGTEDEAVSIQFASRSAEVIRTVGATRNITANLSKLEGQPHVLVTSEVMSAIEAYLVARADGPTRFLLSLVSDLTTSFNSINNRMGKNPLMLF